jgi:hydrogenase small subunit
MAITRRQFVTRLSTLAAAMGMSQVDLAQVTQAFAHGGATGAWAGGDWTRKPKVVWVHGAECTGCSTSLLSLFEDVRGTAVEGTSITTLKALDYAVGGDGTGATVAAPSAGHPYGHRTLQNTDAIVGSNFDDVNVATIADVLIDFIDLQYHETVMGMGGDLAYQWLHQLMVKADGATAPFVLVVEGSIQPFDGGGHWNKPGAAGDVPWCSIGKPEQGAGDLSFDEVVELLAIKSECKAVIPIGQCACFGGYPACVSPVLGSGQTGALGTEAFLKTKCGAAGIEAAKKVIAVPGCPTNPWWFVLTVVAWLVDATAALAGQPSKLNILNADLSIKSTAVDGQRRLKAVYALPLHGPFCKRYPAFKKNIFATKPGEAGCLQLIGCKGPQTMTLCGVHGWNGQNPRNNASLDYGIGATNSGKGGNCVAAGHPCMACTEKGYPDAFLPFVVR